MVNTSKQRCNNEKLYPRIIDCSGGGCEDGMPMEILSKRDIRVENQHLKNNKELGDNRNVKSRTNT